MRSQGATASRIGCNEAFIIQAWGLGVMLAEMVFLFDT